MNSAINPSPAAEYIDEIDSMQPGSFKGVAYIQPVKFRNDHVYTPLPIAEACS